MKVTVELQAFLQQYSPGGESVFDHTLPDGATIQTLVRDLQLPEEMASVIVVNGGSADFDDPLSDGDRVTFIPPLAGG
jgi:molybdopterin converting factor small subunit